MAKRLFARVTFAAVVLFAAAMPAQAWNAAGHMVSGALVYYILKEESPGTLARAVALLKAHPEYAGKWARQINADYVDPADRDLVLFMLAARWPDDLRKGSKLHRPKWHFIDYPYVPPRQPFWFRVPGPNSDNILRAFRINFAGSTAWYKTEQQKAMALAWVFHLVGDVHQPLHTASLYSTTFPQGDRGGNKYFVRARKGNRPVALHRIWDDLVLGSSRYQAVRKRALALHSRPDLTRAQFPELSQGSFDEWARESYNVARAVAYRWGDVAGSPTEAGAPVLPDGYTKQAKATAELRIVLSAYRLADVLKKALGN